MNDVTAAVFEMLDLDDEIESDLKGAMREADDPEWFAYVLNESLNETDTTDEALDLTRRTLERFPEPPEDDEL